MPFMTDAQYQTLPPHIKTYYDNMMADARRIQQEPFQAYNSDRVAEMDGDIRAAHAMGRNFIGAERKQLEEAEEAANRGSRAFHQRDPRTGRQFIDDYMNPYQRHVVQQIAEEGNRNFKENILPALEGRFVKLGRYGGARHGELTRRAARDLQHEILMRQQQALASGYQQAGQFYNAQQARELEASQQLGNLAAARQGSRIADMAILENQGKYRQQQQQAALDAKYQNFLREIEHPSQRLAFQSAMMQGVPHQGINQAYYQTPATPQTSILSALGPMVGQMWMMRNMPSGR
jgi:hypothetical protein